MATTTKAKPGKKKTALRTHIGMLLDRSYSMAPNRDAVVAGYNEFVSELQSDGAEVLTHLWTFDWVDGQEAIVEEVFSGTPLGEVRELSREDYVPRGYTPLNDAVIDVIGRLRKQSKKNDKVMLLVMTDGMENQSRSSAEEVSAEIVKCEKAGWAFLYLGANHDAWDQGGGIGFRADSGTVAYAGTASGTKQAFRRFTQNANLYTSSPGATASAAAQHYYGEAADLSKTVDDPGDPPPSTTAKSYGDINTAKETAKKRLRGE